MTDLIELELLNFFGVSHQTVKLRNQGRVLIVGRNGAGKTSLFIEGPYYALFGKSFEYGERPGDSVGNRFKRSYMVRLDFKVGGHLYRVIRVKNVKEVAGIRLNRDGLFLFKETSEGVWEERSLSRAADTQDYINRLIGMTPLTFTNTTTFSSDVLRLPDFPDAEKKRIINDLLAVGGCDVALKATTKILADVNQEVTLKAALLKVTQTSLSEAQKRMGALVEASEGWERELERKEQERNTRKERIGKEIETKEAEIVRLKAQEGRQNELIGAVVAAKAKIKGKLKRIGELETQAQEEKPSATRSVELRKEIAGLEGGSCPSCNRPYEGTHDHTAQIKKLREELAAAVKEEKADLDRWNKLKQEVVSRKAKENLALEALQEDQDRAEATIRAITRSLATGESQLQSLQDQLDLAEETLNEVNPHTKLLEDAAADVNSYGVAVTTTTEQLEALAERVEDEKLLQELFGNRGCRVSVLDSALPFLNDKCTEIARELKTDIRASFAIRGEGEAYANTIEVMVDNPIGALGYHGNSKGERRLADLIILFSLLSLATASHGATGQVFYDETFENLFPEIKNNVLAAIGKISQQRNSVFIISHVTEGLDLDLIDQVWNVANGEIEVQYSRR